MAGRRPSGMEEEPTLEAKKEHPVEQSVIDRGITVSKEEYDFPSLNSWFQLTTGFLSRKFEEC